MHIDEPAASLGAAAKGATSVTEPIVYIDISRVREGKLDELRTEITALVEFVRDNEPEIVCYAVYFSEDNSQMTVVHVHRDSDSLLFHMKAAGHMFPRFATLLDLLEINVYGTPSPKLSEQLRQKAEMLGTGKVYVHPAHGGFGRFPSRG